LKKVGGIQGQRPRSLSAESEISLRSQDQEDSKIIQWMILRKKPYQGVQPERQVVQLWFCAFDN